jgi:hypothetical protein
MVYSTISRVESEFFEQRNAANHLSNETDNGGNLTENTLTLGYDSAAVKLEIATGLTFWCGVVQVYLS